VPEASGLKSGENLKTAEWPSHRRREGRLRVEKRPEGEERYDEFSEKKKAGPTKRGARC